MRLFTAIEIPGPWRAAAEATAVTIRRNARVPLRMSDPRNAHLTVRFLGEVDGAKVPSLIEALEATSAAPCELHLSAPGTFGSPAHTRVVWLGVDGDADCCARLVGAVDAAVTRAGLEIAQPPWRPHLTLARVHDRATAVERRMLADLVRALPNPEGEPFVAETLSLYRSHLGRGSPRYELLTAVRIG